MGVNEAKAVQYLFQDFNSLYIFTCIRIEINNASVSSAASCTDSKSRKIEASEIRTCLLTVPEHAPELPTRLTKYIHTIKPGRLPLSSDN